MLAGIHEQIKALLQWMLLPAAMEVSPAVFGNFLPVMMVSSPSRIQCKIWDEIVE